MMCTVPAHHPCVEARDPNTSGARLLELANDVPDAVLANPALDLLSLTDPAMWTDIQAVFRKKTLMREVAELVAAITAPHKPLRGRRLVQVGWAELGLPFISGQRQMAAQDLLAAKRQIVRGKRRESKWFALRRTQFEFSSDGEIAEQFASKAVRSAVYAESYPLEDTKSYLLRAVINHAMEEGRSMYVAAADTYQQLLSVAMAVEEEVRAR